MAKFRRTREKKYSYTSPLTMIPFEVDKESKKMTLIIFKLSKLFLFVTFKRFA